MPLPTNPEAYSDVHRAFLVALTSPHGCEQIMPGADAASRKRRAVRWRQRAYAYRRLCQKETERAFAGTDRAEEAGRSEFDALVLTINPEGNVVIYKEDEIMPLPRPLEQPL